MGGAWGTDPVAVVLGSGLGALAEEVEGARRFPFKDLPGFPRSGVSSHKGELILGRLSGRDVALLAGRAHYYEHGDPKIMRVPLETFKALGVSRLLLTNAAGSLREDAPPGSLLVLNDHISWSGLNPLIGEQGDSRFVNMVDAYDPELRATLLAALKAEGQPELQGVYMWFSGPSFETPAEIRMARLLGADAVGMSTVPEVILARHLGLRVGAVSAISNFGAGMTGLPLSHEETKEEGAKLAGRFIAVVRRFLQDLA
ncbi:purine-nucleoside phosphorylase [Neomegalonema sp.]|uniref:purine-nucleoside phosphorylase n=1 Tax=Neomegalonema sp. TaxID=2039713 RepID=UPI00262905BE|nr:purine-nucleoside phosphorylase [Neomegalonema sp.]MDD2869913.1 purine-nucleoside phosphorylase [Neomegalonema sp.]